MLHKNAASTGFVKPKNLYMKCKGAVFSFNEYRKNTVYFYYVLVF